MKNILIFILFGLFGLQAFATETIYIPVVVGERMAPATCETYRNSRKRCDEMPLVNQDRCKVCKEETSCFMAFEGKKQAFCKAYIGSESCFMAFNNDVDRGWCERIVEGKSCFMALNGIERKKCEEGKVPERHVSWGRFGGKLDSF